VKKLRITVNGVSYDVEVEVLEDDDEVGSAYGYGLTAMPMPPMASPAGVAAPVTTPAVKPVSPPPAAGGPTNELTSPIAGVVHKVNVAVGDMVKENQPVVVIEAMKMNTNISSPVAGKVKEIKVNPGDAVQQGQVLVIFE
jgi:biotin carboxyl carrier protein